MKRQIRELLSEQHHKSIIEILQAHLSHLTNHSVGCTIVDTTGIGEAVAKAIKRRERKEET
jgi:hypothetical protein